jgi:hypothetical protein
MLGTCDALRRRLHASAYAPPSAPHAAKQPATRLPRESSPDPRASCGVAGGSRWQQVSAPWLRLGQPSALRAGEETASNKPASNPRPAASCRNWTAGSGPRRTPNGGSGRNGSWRFSAACGWQPCCTRCSSGGALRQEAQSRERWAPRGLPPLGAAHAPSPDVRCLRKPNRVSDGDHVVAAPLGAARAPSPDARCLRKPNRVSDGDRTVAAPLGAARTPSPDARPSGSPIA